MSKNYFELRSDLEELQDALDNETNDEMREEITQNIDDVKEQIENYDLSADDLFKCDSCKRIKDIEESIKTLDGRLICDDCNIRHD